MSTLCQWVIFDTLQLVCGPMESIASVAKTFYDTNRVQGIKIELGFLQWKTYGFFWPELPRTMCVHALFLHVCVCVRQERERESFIFMVQQLDWFWGWSRVRTDLACPVIKGPADKTAEWWHIAWTALVELAAKALILDTHVLTNPSPAVIGWFLDIRKLWIPFFLVIFFYLSLFPLGLNTHLHIQIRPHKCTHTQSTSHTSCRRFDCDRTHSESIMCNK